MDLDEGFLREVEEASRTRKDMPLAMRMWARVTAYGNLNWRIDSEQEALEKLLKKGQRVLDSRPRHDDIGEIRLMAHADGYVMVRRLGRMPFVLSLKDWEKLEIE